MLYFNFHIRDGELCKIWTPSVDELSIFVKANLESCNTRLENRLACHICHCYKWQDTETEYTPECRPIDCYYYYHGECLEKWKAYHLENNKGIAKKNKMFVIPKYC